MPHNPQGRGSCEASGPNGNGSSGPLPGAPHPHSWPAPPRPQAPVSIRPAHLPRLDLPCSKPSSLLWKPSLLPWEPTGPGPAPTGLPSLASIDHPGSALPGRHRPSRASSPWTGVDHPGPAPDQPALPGLALTIPGLLRAPEELRRGLPPAHPSSPLSALTPAGQDTSYPSSRTIDSEYLLQEPDRRQERNRACC